MTREQIAADLLAIALRIANELPPQASPDNPTLPEDVRAAEWVYVKGIASHAILQLRERLMVIA